MADTDSLYIPPQIRLEDLKIWVISKLDIAKFYQDHLPKDAPSLKQMSGDGFSNRTLCPFHNDKNNAAFFVNFNSGNYHCKTCKVHGSVFDFWLHQNGLPSDKAHLIKGLVGVANIAGVDLKKYLEDHKREISAGKLPEEINNARTLAHLKEQEMTKRATTDEHDRNEKPLNWEIAEACQRALRAEHIKYLVQMRGLTRKTIEDRKIGWLENTPEFKHKDTGDFIRGRFSIPIPDREGRLRNLRLYSSLADTAYKMVNYTVDWDKPTKKGYGSPARLTNIEKLLSGIYTNIVITEGEWDEVLLNQKFEEAGYQTWLAVSGTHGTTFLEEWVPHFHGKNVYICQDCDGPGRVHSKNIASVYFLPYLSSGKFEGVREVCLPLEGKPDDKDITDYFLKHKNTVDEFVKLCVGSPEIVAGGIENDEATLEPIKVEHLDMLIRDRRYIDQRVTVPMTIVSAAEQTYHAIRSCTVDRCPLMDKGECCQAAGAETNIPYGHPLFIASCMEREENVLARLRNIVCTKEVDRAKVVPKKKVVMELYYAHQLTERTRQVDGEDGKSVLETTVTELAHVQVYLLQSDIPINVQPKGYMATGWVRTHPKTSTVALFIESMVPIEEDWRRFKMDDPRNREMINFLRKEITTKEIFEEITKGVTLIFDADEILMAVLLMFLSPLYFFFNGKRQRGWINVIIIGDSGVGKSATYTRFSDWVEVGSWFSALTGSRTGLLYAAKQKNNEWYIAAGDYVQNSGGALGIDEAQTLEKEVTRSFANAIDRGYLEVKKVASGGYDAKTRCAIMMNAKKPNGDQATLSDFTYGCEALPVCFDPMFIRRMDLAIFCPQVPNREERYNRYVDKNEKVLTKLSALQMRSLIYWAWTREAKDINFTEEATHECLDMATKLSRIYGAVDKVPLINPNDFRENLARLAVSYAVLDRSIEDDLTTLTILPKHVKIISALIDRVYSDGACGLRQYSEEMARINRMDDAEFDRIKKNMDDFIQEDLTSSQEYYRSTYPTLRVLVYARTTKMFTLRDIMEVTGLTMGWLRRRMDHLKCLDLLFDSQRGNFQVSRKFNLFMMRWRQDKDVEARLEAAKSRLFHAAPPEPKKERNERNERRSNEPVPAQSTQSQRDPDDPFGQDPFGGNDQGF